MQANGFMYPFLKIDRLFDGADLVIGNLEGPITTRATHASPNGPLLFNFDPGSTPILKQIGFSALSLANNHTYNQGKSGFTETKEHLKNAGLEVFGHPREVNANDVLKIQMHGHRYAFVGWNMIEVDDPATEALLALIRELDQSVDRIVVLPHWGAEYRSQTTTQVESAHALIEAGADLIVGAHPHVVQGVEVFENRPILYSLGNFIFDQYWSEPTQEGLAVQVAWTEQSLTVTFLPIDLHASQPHVADETIAARIMERILDSSTLAESDREFLVGQRQLEILFEE
jgi:poly-gamma-glutamate synthesis protein (capsule biosynthesis protein)